MSDFTLKLEGQKQVAERTTAFYFEKPAGFRFTAGQFMRFTLIDPPETDAEGNSRRFSLASAPHEHDLMIATRMRDTAFKRVLQSLSPGAQIAAKGPYGRLTLHDDAARPAAFLAGGIGITPFRSMAFEAPCTHPGHHLYLFYSNRRPEDAPFLDELTELQNRHAKFRLIAVTGSAGMQHPHIDASIVAQFIDDMKLPIFYLAGPPGFVTAMKTMLAQCGASDMDIRIEEFTGY
jgi:ferredoxin-NADP reductase